MSSEKSDYEIGVDLLRQGTDLAEAGQLEKALAKLTQATHWLPDEVDAWRMRGMVEGAMEEFQAAEVSFQKAAALDPKSPDLRYLLATVHMQLNQIELSVEEFQKLIAEQPDFLPAYFDCGTALQLLGHYQEAIEIFERRQALEPDFDTCLMCAMTYEMLGDYEHSEKYYAEAVKLDPENTMVIENHGTACLELERYDDALVDFNRSLELDPDSSDALCGRGRVYLAQENLNAAKADLERAVRLDPDNVFAWHALGTTHFELEEHTESLECFDTALELAPDLLCYDMRAASRRILGDLEGSLHETELGLDEDPNDTMVLQERGETLHALERFEEARDTFSKILEMDSESIDALTWRGFTLMDLLEYPHAIADFTRAIALDPKYAVAFLFRANAYYQMENNDKALADIRTAKKLAEKEKNEDLIERCDLFLKEM